MSTFNRSSIGSISRRALPYLLLPVGILGVLSVVAFRKPLSSPLQIPQGWPAPWVPADNPITAEKFELGRQLFYEVELSGDRKTSCGTCHNPKASFGNLKGGAHVGAFNHSSVPARNVPRIVNVAYDSVITWDGHL